MGVRAPFFRYHRGRWWREKRCSPTVTTILCLFRGSVAEKGGGEPSMSCDSFEYVFHFRPRIAGRSRQAKVNAWVSADDHSKGSLGHEPEPLRAVDEATEAGRS